MKKLDEMAPNQSPDEQTPSSGKRENPIFRYVDRPECVETFADAINSMYFDGQSLRIEFGISRVDELKPDTAMTGRRYPACRLVLPPSAAIELVNRMQQVAVGLAKAGVAKQTAQPAAPTKSS